MLPVISDFLFDDAPTCSSELALRERHPRRVPGAGRQRVRLRRRRRLGRLDHRADVETGGTRVMSRRAFRALARRRAAWQDEVARGGAGRRPRRGGARRRSGRRARSRWPSSWPSGGCGRWRDETRACDRRGLAARAADRRRAALDAATTRAARPRRPVADASAEVPCSAGGAPSTGAIRVGEIVDVTLTCAVLESDAVRAVPDESRLTVAAVQLAPFEIVGGSHPADLRAGERRFFQYATSCGSSTPTRSAATSSCRRWPSRTA